MSIKEIKQRISSVKKTKKMTSAMKMVAASKFKRTLRTIRARHDYSNAIEGIKNDILPTVSPELFPYHLLPNKSEKELVIIFSSDRGLCGGFNTTLFKIAERHLSSASHPIELALIGNKAIQYFKKRNYPKRIELSQFQLPAFQGLGEQLATPILEAYHSGEFKTVTLIYNHFVNALKSDPKAASLLPVAYSSDPNDTTQSEFFFEPSPTEFLTRFFDQFIHDQLVQAALNTAAGESGARMTAMDAASKNATEMIGDLTLLYNRTRQAAITTELTEIVAGATALTQ